MRKLVFVYIMVILCTACQFEGQNTPQKPNGLIDKDASNYDENNKEDSRVEGGQDISTADDIELDINAIDIEEDKVLTQEAKDNGRDKHDITLMKNTNFDRIKDNANNDFINGIEMIESYHTKVPDDISVNLLYTKYQVPFDYLLIMKDETTIYKEPSYDSVSIGTAYQHVKVKIEGKVKDKGEDRTNGTWYVITWMEESKPVFGFVPSDAGEVHTFRFKEMVQEIRDLDRRMKEKDYGYISNYKDRNGSPPLLNGKGIDQYGIQAYQSAPAYWDLNDKGRFRYFPDGMLVFIQGEDSGYFKVSNKIYEGNYWIPKNYISFEDNLDVLNKVVVVDVTNQNQAAFERNGGTWNIVSYTLATTGVKAQHKFETPEGYFKVLEKKEKSYYLDDTTRELAGYGPYGTRFSAGAYIHGVPVPYEKRDGENVDPGLQEYLFTIGTVPRSHKCVRNYTSHAKFIYDWSNIHDTAIIVIE